METTATAEAPIFKLSLLPARYGDALWLTYGSAAQLHYVLIDGGTGGTRKDIEKLISELPEGGRHLELLVVTHLDRDHIEGILRLLEKDSFEPSVGEVWFNAWPQLTEEQKEESFGSRQAENLSARLIHHQLSWNKYFGGKAVCIPEQGALPEIILPGGLRLTLLSPGRADLDRLIPVWEEELRILGLEPGYGITQTSETADGDEGFGVELLDVEALAAEPFHEDKAEGNGSSIAFLAEFAGKRCLFAGDALPSNILRALNRLDKDKTQLDLFKLSHHASAHNTSPELLEKIDSKRYVISTNGAIYKHPSPQTIARILKSGSPDKELIFNYWTPFTEPWDDAYQKLSYAYRATYAEGDVYTIDLLKN